MGWFVLYLRVYPFPFCGNQPREIPMKFLVFSLACVACVLTACKLSMEANACETVASAVTIDSVRVQVRFVGWQKKHQEVWYWAESSKRTRRKIDLKPGSTYRMLLDDYPAQGRTVIYGMEEVKSCK